MEKTRKLTLQVGESTHTHVLESEKDIKYTQGKGGDVHFVLDGVGILKHEEHGTMVFTPGNYFKFPQVEFDPMMGDIRQVFD